MFLPPEISRSSPVSDFNTEPDFLGNLEASSRAPFGQRDMQELFRLQFAFHTNSMGEHSQDGDDARCMQEANFSIFLVRSNFPRILGKSCCINIDVQIVSIESITFSSPPLSGGGLII